MGTIYEIICWTTGLRYIGKTTLDLKERLRTHQYSKSSSQLVLEHGNYEIYELEKVDDKTLLTEREFFYIQHTDCVNIFTGDFDRKKCDIKYAKTEKCKAAQKKYRQSEKGKAAQKKKNQKANPNYLIR